MSSGNACEDLIKKPERSARTVDIVANVVRQPPPKVVVEALSDRTPAGLHRRSVGIVDCSSTRTEDKEPYVCQWHSLRTANLADTVTFTATRLQQGPWKYHYSPNQIPHKHSAKKVSVCASGKLPIWT